MFNVEQTISEIKDFIQKNNIKRDCKALADFLFKKGFYWGQLGTGKRDYTLSLSIGVKETSKRGKCLVVGTASRGGKYVTYQGYYLPIK